MAVKYFETAALQVWYSLCQSTPRGHEDPTLVYSFLQQGEKSETDTEIM